MIDIHTHIGRIDFRKPLRPYQLLKFMDKNEIEKAVVLPIENPEETYYYVTTDEVLRACKRHSDRLIPFCNVDPRRGNSNISTDFYKIIREYKERGCKGFGEALSGLWIDDIRSQKIYEACGKLRMPIIIHLDGLRNLDNKGLPKLEKMLNKFPKTIFVGHAQHFWAEISADVKKKDFVSYPKGKIKKGALDKLFSKYHNLYGDLSAGSGYNALFRDRDFTYPFLERNQNKLLFGTDYLSPEQKCPQIEFLKEAKENGLIKKFVFEKIAFKNARKLLKIR